MTEFQRKEIAKMLQNVSDKSGEDINPNKGAIDNQIRDTKSLAANFEWTSLTQLNSIKEIRDRVTSALREQEFKSIGSGQSSDYAALDAYNNVMGAYQAKEKSYQQGVMTNRDLTFTNIDADLNYAVGLLSDDEYNSLAGTLESTTQAEADVANSNNARAAAQLERDRQKNAEKNAMDPFGYLARG